MRFVDIIAKKRDNKELSQDEIKYFVDGFTNGTIPDYQASAFLMAIYFNGMTKLESSILTDAMLNSGDKIDLSGIEGIKVDKHSTGGVGDKTTLIVGPIVSSCGVPFAKLSGRGLGHTGGTIDKLEAIKDFKISLSTKEFIDQVNNIQISLVGQTENLTPADKKIYALRDVTSTVESIPLIASSIMSKKLASGSDAIVLDVKVGSGAFMKNIDDAKELSKTMVDIGTSLGKRTIAVLTNMDQVLGYAVGNLNEVLEAVDTLKGNGPEDLHELSIELSAHMISLGKNISYEEAKLLAEESISSGKAYAQFEKLVKSQHGKIESIKEPVVKHTKDIYFDNSGTLSSMNTSSIGICAMKLGAGREVKDDVLDYNVGLKIYPKIGDKVDNNTKLATIYSNTDITEDYINELKSAFTLSTNANKSNIIIDIIK